MTSHPYAEWAAQQIIDAFPYEEAPRFLLRDRDGIYGDYFQKRVKDMGIEEVLIAPRSPWQNPYCERVIGSIRRDCLDHVIVLNESPSAPHPDRVLRVLSQFAAASFPGSQLADTTLQSNRRPRAKSLPSRKSAAYTIGTHGVPRDR